ncbi:(S)-2,3-di-O-geranylgeranylglyceryl phosphate synthase [Anaerohalosphaera lusitana]|uniref:(S)-2,3-di-O-geranylgeranylglyceryl phosphate synthase n=1 Tax=Anaerohalosphaera lusitana TaxID=1936003 RepID=A0A1U9NIN7_9BACT|nr:UbiA family prenyltransferase [Anaerohalosphaera lusitana]AQT67793.1 (S)-2,3-di-O-geranylgeranylglyceryl phosphate synthase [Anaerohalosphaera lusitana]
MIISLLRLTRLYYSLPLAGGFIVILSYLTAGNLSPAMNEIIPAFFSVLTIISAGYVLNDVCDVHIDRINCPRRTLPSRRLEPKPALIFSIMLFITGLSLAAFCGIAFFLTSAIVTVLLICYDLVSKRIGVFKDLFVAALMTSLYPLAFALLEPVDTPRLSVLYIHPAWLFFSSLGYEMLKDIRDAAGDSRNSPQPVYYSIRKSFAIASRLSIITASLITLLPFILGLCHEVYLVSSLTAVVLATLAAFSRPTVAIRYVYAEVALITAGSLVDLLVFGP